MTTEKGQGAKKFFGIFKKNLSVRRRWPSVLIRKLARAPIRELRNAIGKHKTKEKGKAKKKITKKQKEITKRY